MDSYKGTNVFLITSTIVIWMLGIWNFQYINVLLYSCTCIIHSGECILWLYGPLVTYKYV